MYNKGKIWTALPSGSETINQVVTGSKKEGSGDIFGLRSYKIKADTRQSSISMGKGNRENIPAIKEHNGSSPQIKDHNGQLITDPLEKSDVLNSYYASVFSCKRNNPQIQ